MTAVAARIIGLGQRFGGDDGVGIAVADRIRQMGPPAGVEVVTVADATDLAFALVTDATVVVVDAVLDAGEPGSLHVLAPGALGEAPLAAVSTHGLDLGSAIALARALHPAAVSRHVHVIGISIARALRFTEGLSPAVAAAVEPAAAAVLGISRATRAEPRGT